jgi:signal transduction histidine kinase
MHSLSLKFRITALALLAAVIPLFIFNGISAQRSKENMITTATDDIKAQSVLVGKDIDRYLKQRLVDIKMIAQADVLRTNNKAQILDYIKSMAYENDAIEDICVLDLNGVITASATAPKKEGYVGWDINLGIKELLLVVKNAANGMILASEAHMGDEDPQIIMVTPIYDISRLNPVAILMVENNIRGVKNIVLEFGELNEDYKRIYVVDKLGRVVLTTNTEMPLFETLADIRIQPAILGDATSGTAIYKNAQGERVITGFSDLKQITENKSLDWSVLTTAPLDKLLRPTKETAQVLTYIGLFVTSLTVLIAYFFARSITQPLQRTAALAEQISRGNYSHRLEENVGGEIGSLAKSINDMAMRVEERAAEITTRNEKLTSEIVERKIAQDRLRKLSHKIVRLQEEERRRVSRELHDGINQLLVSVKYKIENFEDKFNQSAEQALSDIKKADIFLDEAISEVRRVSHDLRPSVLDDLGLVPAISNLVRRFSERNLIDVQLNGVDESFDRLPTDVETAMYRIVQEALMNIEKHANASHVSINISRTDSNVTIRIEDNGEGFSMQNALRKSESTRSMGLRNMRERIELLQGTFFIHSDVGKGTFLEVKAPLNLDTPLNLET